jgi:hypothetical protein
MRLGQRIGPHSLLGRHFRYPLLHALAAAGMCFLENPARAVGAERGRLAGKPGLLDLPVDIADCAGEAIGGRVVPQEATEALVGHAHSSNQAPSWSGAEDIASPGRSQLPAIANKLLLSNGLTSISMCTEIALSHAFRARSFLGQ